jgi:L-lactate dehydrogenase complex protein LldG
MSLSATVQQSHTERAGLVTRFIAEARAVAASIEIVERSAAAIATAVTKAAPEAKRIVIAQATHVPDDLFALCRKMPGVFTEQTRSALAAADLGITDAFAAIATTGTVCVRVDAGITGYASLLARKHVVVVDSERIVERPSDLFRADCLNGEGLHANFVYITGPSATADMGPLVRGVHGPHFLHILVLQ